jgi:CrcB protein
MERYLLIMLGAALGGAARFAVQSAALVRFDGRFPLGTLIVNVTGCFLIGLLLPFLAARPELSQNWRLLLVVGVLGGYTTFSSFAWEAFQSVRDGFPMMGLLYVTLSVVLGYLAVWGGALITRR